MARPAGSTSSSSRRRPAASRAASPRPKKSLGQHFLSDRNLIARIVDAAELVAGDTVLEIGAGPGEMTAVMAERGLWVTAIEIDGVLAEGLRQRFSSQGNVRVMEADALEVKPRELFPNREPYALVANLPYNVGTVIVRRLLESDNPPYRMVVMLQKEVASVMVAPPGEMGLVSVGVQVYATGRKLFDVPPGAFRPPPKVTSSVIRLDAREEPLVAAGERRRFFEVVRAGFSAPRKQLRNALANGLHIGLAESEGAIRAAGLDPAQRPQKLSIPDWLRLTRALGG